MLEHKQTEKLYNQSYISYFASYFGAILAYWLFQGIANDKVLLNWFIIFTVITIVRFALSIYYKFNQSKRDNEFWLILFLVMTAVSGTLWGLTGFLFFPEKALNIIDSVLYHGILLLFVATLIAGSIITYSASRLVYLSFSIPAIIPHCFLLISIGDKYHSFLGGIVLAYAAIMFIMAAYIHRVFSEACKVELQNEYLKKLLKDNKVKFEE